MKRKCIIFAALAIATFWTTVPLSADETDSLRLESARFDKESQFMREQGRYAAALEKAENAVALAPESVPYRQHLTVALIEQATEILRPGWGKKQNLGGVPYTEIDHETLLEAIRLANRAQDVFESLPFQPKRLNFNVDRIMSSLRGMIAQCVLRQHADCRPEFDALNRRILESWLEKRYRPTMREVNDKKSFRAYMNLLTRADGLFMCYLPDASYIIPIQSPAVTALTYEILVRDYLQIADGREFPYELQNPRRSLLRGFQRFMNVYVNLPEDKRDPSVETILDRTCTLLENNPEPVHKMYGWFARHKTGWAIAQNEAEIENGRIYFEKLMKLLEELPIGLPRDDYSRIYEELSMVSDYAKGIHAGVRLDKEGNSVVLPLLVRILRQANRREERARWVCENLIAELAYLLSKKSDGINLSEYKKLLVEQIAICEKQSETDPDAKSDAVSLRKLAEEKRIALQIEEGQEQNAPWKEEIELLRYERGPVLRKGINVHPYRRTMISGNNVYFFVLAKDGRMRLDKVDLETYEYKKGMLIPDDYTPGAKELFEGISPFIDEKNAYWGTAGNGLLVFPTDLSKPWSVTLEDGLPNGYVQGIGSIDGRIYMGIGEENNQSWLVAVDLKTKNLDILCSSNGREGKAPFFNLAPAPRFSCFCADTKRNRLLMFVHFPLNHYYKQTGVWAIDGETGCFEQIAHFDERPNAMRLTVDGDHLRVGQHLVDLKNTSPEIQPELLYSHNNKFYQGNRLTDIQPKYRDITRLDVEVDGWYWGVSGEKISGFWNRISTDGKTIEKLKPLASERGVDRIIGVAPDGKGIIVNSYGTMVLLRFE